MSMRYIASPWVRGYDKSKEGAIRDVLKHMVGDDIGQEDVFLFASGEAEGDVEKFVRELTTKILKANNAPCAVEVGITYIEEAPYDIFDYSEEEAEKLF